MEPSRRIHDRTGAPNILNNAIENINTNSRTDRAKKVISKIFFYEKRNETINETTVSYEGRRAGVAFKSEAAERLPPASLLKKNPRYRIRELN